MALDCTKITTAEKTWLKKGSKGKQVEELQKLLKTHGYYTQYSVDGDFGPQTHNAVVAFQKKKGLSADGKVGSKTCPVLNGVQAKTEVVAKTVGFDCPHTDLKKDQPNDKAQVEKLQNGLKQLGYYTSVGKTTLKVDGVYGQYTAEAVAAFQRSVGESPDGWFGPKTCVWFNQKLGWADAPAQAKTTTVIKKAEEIVIDAEKVNFLDRKKCNFIIDGVFLISSSVEDTRSVENGDWQVLEMMGDKTYTYMGHTQPREYDVTVYLREEDWQKVRQAFILMTKKVCDVQGFGLTGGKYVITWTFSAENKVWRKVVFHLIQYRG